MVHRNNNGITVKELKEFVKNLPETNPDTGEDCEVWLEMYRNGSSPATSLWNLNTRISDKDKPYSDILIAVGS